ncbi:MAG: hypothetical protein PHR35_05560 [Kiritimatiellae bacterium]|nr:hypothetical protein [Kiritimatiellia bacterium]
MAAIRLSRSRPCSNREGTVRNISSHASSHTLSVTLRRSALSLRPSVNLNAQCSNIECREALGSRFAHGIVLYGGDEALTLGNRIFAVPLTFLRGGGRNTAAADR